MEEEGESEEAGNSRSPGISPAGTPRIQVLLDIRSFREMARVLPRPEVGGLLLSSGREVMG